MSTNTTVTVISICDQSSAVVPIFRVPNNFIVRTLNEMKRGGDVVVILRPREFA